MLLVMYWFNYFVSNISFSLVLYAPHLGVAGLDSTDVKSRFEVYCLECRLEQEDPSTVLPSSQVQLLHNHESSDFSLCLYPCRFLTSWRVLKFEIIIERGCYLHAYQNIQ